MFVKSSRVRRGNREYEYLSLAEAFRDDAGKSRHRTILRLGEASTLRSTGELERIVAALQRHLERGNEDDLIAAGDLEAAAAPAVGAMAAVDAYWRRLGFSDHFGGRETAAAVFAMIANRLISPGSKRRVPEWAANDVVMPDWFTSPPLQRYYRAVDAVAEAKDATEQHLYARLCDLANLDLRLVLYNVTSTYFEGTARASDRFPSRAFGYSRDHRSDRPQVVIGLLCTTDGIPIAHHVFAGNTADVATLPGVLDDLATRFGVGQVCVIADRGLISVDNVDELAHHGFAHVLATRLHRDRACAQALDAVAGDDVQWVPVPEARCSACEVTLDDGRRAVVVASAERHERDTLRTAELVARTEAKLLALEARVRDGRLVDAGKIGRAAQRILGPSGVGRLFDVEIDTGRFVYHYNDDAIAYETLLAGRYVLLTSLTRAQASTAQVVLAYRQLTQVEARFRVLKDFLHLRPVYHWTEQRVRGHVALCVYAAVIEALMTADLAAAGVTDPDLDDQALTPGRALRELARIRAVTLTAGERNIDLITQRSPLQARILDALHVNTSTWNRAHIH